MLLENLIVPILYLTISNCLAPCTILTLRFILGAIDDLIEYYSCYERMNLIPTIFIGNICKLDIDFIQYVLLHKYFM